MYCVPWRNRGYLWIEDDELRPNSVVGWEFYTLLFGASSRGAAFWTLDDECLGQPPPPLFSLYTEYRVFLRTSGGMWATTWRWVHPASFQESYQRVRGGGGIYTRGERDTLSIQENL